MKGWKLDFDGAGIARLSLNLPEAKVNKLTSGVLRELGERLDQVAAHSGVRLLVIASDKVDCFVAGADIDELAALADPDEARAKAREGQVLFTRLSELPCPTLAVIDGACLGGGLELALACDFRLCTDHPKTILGFPEVKLGIIPGFGGTQRLPRLIGLPDALKLILTGKPVDGKKAARLKLVDRCVPREFLAERLAALTKELANRNQRQALLARRRGDWKSWLIQGNPVGRHLVCRQAKATVQRKGGSHYPAPFAAIGAIRAGLGLPLSEGLRREADAFAGIATGAIARHLVRLYYLDERVKKDPGIALTAEPSTVVNTAVVGAGVMGGGIAWLLASNGLGVRLKDVNWEAVGRGYQSAAGIFRTLQRLGTYSEREAGLAMHRLTGTIDYSGFGRTDLVIEAVVEHPDVKRRVYADLEAVLPESTIIATNTSTLPIDSLARELRHPERFLGMHFFNPVDRMPLVEVIPGSKTSPTAIATVVNLSRTIGKKPMAVGSCPGFLVNRILLPYLNEAVALLTEGTELERIDGAMTAYGMPMGPLRLLDEIGLDVALKCGQTLSAAYPERLPMAPFLDAAVSHYDLIGRKGDLGFYRYGGKRPRPEPRLAGLLADFRQRLDIAPRRASDRDIHDRLLLSMINEASRCLDERIAANADYLDYALILGIGFPPFRGGLLRYADALGASAVAGRLDDLTVRVGERFAPSHYLIQLAAREDRFHEIQRQRPEAGLAGSGGGRPADRVESVELHGRPVHG